jgi:hypothetical protein
MKREFNYDKSLLNYYNKDSLKLPKNLEQLNNFLNIIESKLSIKIGNMLGLGFEGQVYEIIDSNKCIKFQTRTCDDYSDITTQLFLLDKQLDSIANIYEVGVIKINDNKLNSICINGDLNEIYYIISENLSVNWKLKELFENLENDYIEFSDKLKINDNIEYDNQGDNLLGFLEDFIDYDPNQYIDQFRENTLFKNSVERLIFCLEELKQNDIEYNDFVVKNIGFNKNNDLTIFDLNGFEGDEDEIDLEKLKVLNI